MGKKSRFSPLSDSKSGWKLPVVIQDRTLLFEKKRASNLIGASFSELTNFYDEHSYQFMEKVQNESSRGEFLGKWRSIVTTQISNIFLNETYWDSYDGGCKNSKQPERLFSEFWDRSFIIGHLLMLANTNSKYASTRPTYLNMSKIQFPKYCDSSIPIGD